MGIIGLVVLIILVCALLPAWPHTRDRGWGYYPSGGLGLLAVVLLILLLVGRIPWWY